MFFDFLWGGINNAATAVDAATQSGTRQDLSGAFSLEDSSPSGTRQDLSGAFSSEDQSPWYSWVSRGTDAGGLAGAFDDGTTSGAATTSNFWQDAINNIIGLGLLGMRLKNDGETESNPPDYTVPPIIVTPSAQKDNTGLFITLAIGAVLLMFLMRS